MGATPDASEAEGTKPRSAYAERVYGSSTTAAPPEQKAPRGPLFSRKQLIAAAVPLVMAIGLFAAGGVIEGGRPEVGPTQEQKSVLFSLQDESREYEALTAGLPKAYDVERALLSSREAAQQVASLQESYGFFTQRVAESGGKLEQGTGAGVSRDLSPYFGQKSVEVGKSPWYLLESDAERGEGSGLVKTFTSGYTWSPLDPQIVDPSGRVGMTWVATERWAPKGQEPRILAWASAEYDVLRRTFEDLKVAHTQTGQALSAMDSPEPPAPQEEQPNDKAEQKEQN